jgi:hypothetical protein
MLKGLDPGDALPRREVHLRFGGRQQSGISPTRANAVLFFTSPSTGHRQGSYDGWDEDGYFHYVGEGQRGDQQLTQGNKAILNHKADGRSLEGFRGTHGGEVTYLGEFELAEYYFTDAHEFRDPDTLRQVVVFKLRPLSDIPVALPNVPISPQAGPRVERVPVEEQHTERAFVSPDREPSELERREAGLARRYSLHLQRCGHDVGRLRLVPPGESRPLYPDLWDATKRELIEAKGTVNRDVLRQAVGQLLDYQRFASAASLAVLVPTRPRADLIDYLHSMGIRIIYPLGDDDWAHTNPTGDNT